MPQLDRVKEEVGYFKLLQGIALVTFLSLVGWLVSASDGAGRITVILAITGVALLAIAVLALHREIGRGIDEIGKL